MSVRVKRYANESPDRAEPYPQAGKISDRETTVDGQTFHWGPNEVRNFLDDSVGERHAAFYGGASVITEDAIPFGGSHS
jgi:hypothetical protein